VDTIKFNKILPPASPARKVTRPDSNGHNNQQSPFKDGLDRKRRKKKKDDLQQSKVSEREIPMSTLPRQKRNTRKGEEQPDQSKASSQSRLIDIRA
jgi:hypothetical protein